MEEYTIQRKAEVAVKRRKVVRLVSPNGELPVYVVLGNSRDHIVSSSSCDCENFRYNTILRGGKTPCWHIMAVRLSVAQDKVFKITASEDEIRRLFLEFAFSGKSLLLRKMIARS